MSLWETLHIQITAVGHQKFSVELWRLQIDELFATLAYNYESGFPELM